MSETRPDVAGSSPARHSSAIPSSVSTRVITSAFSTIAALDQPPETVDSPSTREVPIPWEVRPIAKPRARSSRTRTRLSSADAAEYADLLYNVYLGLLIGWAAGIYDTEHLTSQAASSIERLNTAFGVTQ